MTAGGRVVVLGASGLVGRALLPALAAVKPGVSLAGTTLTDAQPLPPGVEPRRLDAHDTVQLASLLHDLRPETVIMSTRFGREADYTPEQMEKEVKLARRLSAWLEKTGGRLVVLSTASVFSGRLGGYREEDEPDPITRYGETRAEIERQVRILGVKSLVIRLGRINGFRPWRETRFETLWRALRAGARPAFRADVHQNPLGARAAARAIATLWAANLEGTWHVAGGEPMSDRDHARRVAIALGLGPDATTEAPPDPNETPIELTLDPTRASRKLRALGLAFPPPFTADLAEILDDAPRT